MATRLTAMEFATSLLTPTAQTLTAELDFQLSAREAIEIMSIYGNVVDVVDASTSAGSVTPGVQTVHMETGALEDPLNADGDDAVRLSSEIIYRQDVINFEGGAATVGTAQSIIVTPNAPVVFNDGKGNGLLSGLNLTHRAENPSTGIRNSLQVTIAYFRVRISDREAVALFSRRR